MEKIGRKRRGKFLRILLAAGKWKKTGEDIGNRHGFPVKGGRKPSADSSAISRARIRSWMRDRGGGGVGHGARIFNAINAPYPRLAFRGGQCRTRIMHALFGMSQTRQGGTRPEPSLPPFSLPNLRLRSLTMDRLPGAAIFPHTCSRLCQRPRRSFSSPCEGKIGILVFLADNGDKRFGKIDRPLVF